MEHTPNRRQDKSRAAHAPSVVQTQSEPVEELDVCSDAKDLRSNPKEYRRIWQEIEKGWNQNSVDTPENRRQSQI